MKKTGLIIVGCVLSAILIFVCISVMNPQGDIYGPKTTGSSHTSPLAKKNADSTSHRQLPFKTPPPGQSQQGEMSVEDRLVKELQKYYGNTIGKKSTQALLLKVKDFVLSLYPEDGEARFNSILKKAFPELADEIILTLKKLGEYNQWLETTRQRLAEMDPLEREGAIWEKRTELFGDAAREIWSEERYAHEQRKQEMKETMSLLQESYDISIDEKLEVYLAALDDAYADTPEAYTLENRGLLAKIFFSIESVQTELKSMDPELRQDELDRIRREMGFTEAQIEEHHNIDEYRNRRWDNGLAYMEERDALTTEYDGPELEKQLKTLREKYFKHEAITIEREEKDNFFRFNRKRVHGRN